MGSTTRFVKPSQYEREDSSDEFFPFSRSGISTPEDAETTPTRVIGPGGHSTLTSGVVQGPDGPSLGLSIRATNHLGY